MEHCFNHPDRETGRHCTRCGRAACADCLVPASVGAHCTVCVREAQPSRAEARRVRVATQGAPVVVTRALIGLNLAVFALGVALDGGRTDNIELAQDYGLFAPFVALDGEWWRIVTVGFLHSGPLHLIMNMVALWFLGSAVEPALGANRFAALYATGLVSGSLGALLIEPTGFGVGASGAIFGLMGALVTGYASRGVNPFSSGLGPVLLINLLITFTIPGISIGAHLGGLAGGALVGWILLEPSGRLPRHAAAGLAWAIATGVGLACLQAADRAISAF